MKAIHAVNQGQYIGLLLTHERGNKYRVVEPMGQRRAGDAVELPANRVVICASLETPSDLDQLAIDAAKKGLGLA